MNINMLKKVLKNIEEMIKDNSKILIKLNEEDNEFCDFELDFDKLLEITDTYINKEIIEYNNYGKICLSHYGNPYITLMLCLEAIRRQKSVTIVIEDICYGMNKGIIRIVNDSLKYYKVDIFIDFKNNVTEEDIKNSNFDKIICVGNSNIYGDYKKVFSNIEYMPFFDILLYYDSVDYEELSEKIREYSVDNFYEIEIFDETESFENFMKIAIMEDNKYCVVLLSKDENKQKIFKENINSKYICVNENPFKYFRFEM